MKAELSLSETECEIMDQVNLETIQAVMTALKPRATVECLGSKEYLVRVKGDPAEAQRLRAKYEQDLKNAAGEVIFKKAYAKKELQHGMDWRTLNFGGEDAIIHIFTENNGRSYHYQVQRASISESNLGLIPVDTLLQTFGILIPSDRFEK